VNEDFEGCVECRRHIIGVTKQFTDQAFTKRLQRWTWGSSRKRSNDLRIRLSSEVLTVTAAPSARTELRP
jgi:hypothetical protein